MPNTADLLAEFTQFSDQTLEKLLVIGTSILSPMETELTSVDFASMVDQVFRDNGLVERFFPEMTDTGKLNFGRFLIEVFAVFSDKDMFYVNSFSDEAFIGKAELYRSIFHKAFHEGHNPPSNVSATGDVELIFASGASENVERGAVVLAVSAMDGLQYLNMPFTIPASSIDQPVTVTFVHGKLRQEQGFFDGYSIRINTPSTVWKSIVLTIDGDVWEEVDSFLNSGVSSMHFQVVYDEAGRPEILFGKDGMGAVPPVDMLWEAEMILGGGYIGDIQADTIDTIQNSSTDRNLISFTQFAISGGNSQLPMEQLRQTVIGQRRAQDRIVTPEDATTFVNTLEFVAKSWAESFQDYVYIYVLPVGGGNLSPSQINLVRNLILPADPTQRLLMMGYYLTVASPIYVPVTLVIDVYITNNTPKAGAYSSASGIIREQLDPQQKGEFGGGVIMSNISSQLYARVRGIQNAVITALYRTGMPAPASDINFISQEVVDWANSSITINIIGGI